MDDKRTTIFLAPEIIGRVLELATDDLLEYPYPYSECRFRLLYAASLVCRTWKAEAQLQLWQKIHLVDEERAQLILDSPVLGKYRTPQLTIAPELVESVIRTSPGLTAASAVAVVASLRGIECLFVSHWSRSENLGSSIFSLPSLKELKYLHLVNSQIWTDLSSFPLFSLQQLVIHGPLSTFRNFPFPWVILFSPSLRHLTISPHDFNGNEEVILKRVFSVASHLRVLTLTRNPPPSWDYIFSSCVNISHLKLIVKELGKHLDRSVQLVNTFPSHQISTLTLRIRMPASATPFLQRINNSPKLQNLKKLILSCGTLRGMSGLGEVGREEIWSELRARGVTIVVEAESERDSLKNWGRIWD